MKIYFNEKEAVKVVTNNKLVKFEVKDIDKIYVTYDYFFII